MDENLDFLNKARVIFSELLIHIGCQQLEIFPQADPAEFLETFLPPRNDIFEILLDEQARLKKKQQRSREMKIKTKTNRGRFTKSQIAQLTFAACA
jgi:hypothetical protein